MGKPPEDRSPVLDYSTAPSSRGGLVALSIGALIWAYFTLAFGTGEFFRTPGALARNNFRLGVQVPLLLFAAIRLGWAAYRREKGKGWAFYLTLLFLAAPLWKLAEAIRYKD
jgi:hypothetical protein